MSEWKEPEDIFEAQNLANRVHDDNFADIFEKENARNWLHEHYGWRIK